ncbi:MAG: ABC transporter ATP-binding protein [Planctomycetota bacterium]
MVPAALDLTARFALRRGALALDVALDVRAGETVALVGPNGAGKTSLLMALAGLVRPERGSIRLGAITLDDDATHVCPEERGLGVVFQQPCLFPHLTALENVAYGPRAVGVQRREARARAGTWLERVGLHSRASAKPAALSGGEQQRVARARARACEPRMLLLDEPLSAVDASARLALRRELRAHLQAFEGPRVVVAHDAVDAFALADRVAVLEAGRIVQVGTVDEICSRPQSRYVADLVGLNCFHGTARGGLVEVNGGGTLVSATPIDGPVLATVHPRAVALFNARPSGSPRNVWLAPVMGVEPIPGGLRVEVGGALHLVAEVTASGASALGLASDPRSGRSSGAERPREVWVALKASEIALHQA